MDSYWLGLLTLPAIAGGLGALAGLYWLASTIANAVLAGIRPRDNHFTRSQIAAAVASCRFAVIFRVGRLFAITISAGRYAPWLRPSELTHDIARIMHRAKTDDEAST
jgi:hypothetical protein